MPRITVTAFQRHEYSKDVEVSEDLYQHLVEAQGDDAALAFLLDPILTFYPEDAQDEDPLEDITFYNINPE